MTDTNVNKVYIDFDDDLNNIINQPEKPKKITKNKNKIGNVNIILANDINKIIVDFDN